MRELVHTACGAPAFADRFRFTAEATPHADQGPAPEERQTGLAGAVPGAVCRSSALRDGHEPRRGNNDACERVVASISWSFPDPLARLARDCSLPFGCAPPCVSPSSSRSGSSSTTRIGEAAPRRLCAMHSLVPIIAATNLGATGPGARIPANGMTQVAMGRRPGAGPDFEAARAAIGLALRSLHSDVLSEPLPEKIVELLRQLDRQKGAADV